MCNRSGSENWELTHIAERGISSGSVFYVARIFKSLLLVKHMKMSSLKSSICTVNIFRRAKKITMELILIAISKDKTKFLRNLFVLVPL